MSTRQNSDSKGMKLSQQFRLHSVAIISLITAIAGFTYNSVQTGWIEKNATRRDATFETLLALGELQEIVNYAHYGTDKTDGNPISGWSKVLLVKDLTVLVKPENEKTFSTLVEVWQRHASTLEHTESEKNVSTAIFAASVKALKVLDDL